MTIYDVRAVQAHDKMTGRMFDALDKATSAKPAVRNRRASKRVGSGEMVLLRLSSAEALLSAWKQRARVLQEAANIGCLEYGNFNDRTLRLEVHRIMECVKELRLLLERAERRQPQENAKAQPAAQNP